jgi:zinc transporter ZupT
MMPQYHLVSSFILALIFFYFTNSLLVSLLCFLSGFLLDLDHLLDFWLYKKRITLSNEVFHEFYKNWDKVPVLLHSIEFLIPIWIFAYIFGSYIFSLAITIGFISHLALDFFSYKLHPLSYFLTYRIIKNFDRKFICKTGK